MAAGWWEFKAAVGKELSKHDFELITVVVHVPLH